MKTKLGSRKFWSMVVSVIIFMFIPMIFKRMEIDSSVTLMSLGMIGGIISMYFGVNLLEKKIGGV